MPTYSRFCPKCGSNFTRWQSIHDNSPILCDTCGVKTMNVVEKVNTYAVGGRGQHTAISDQQDRVWHKDMDAYKRFRNKGIQPPTITGADRLEATAVGTFHVETGMAHRDEAVAAKTEEAKALMRGQA